MTGSAGWTIGVAGLAARGRGGRAAALTGGRMAGSVRRIVRIAGPAARAAAARPRA